MLSQLCKLYEKHNDRLYVILYCTNGTRKQVQYVLGNSMILN